MIERYDVKEISSLFSLEKRYETFLKVELANVKALSKLGVVPNEDYQKIKEKASVNVDRINELEGIYHHDVIAFCRSIDEKLGDEKRWFHYGLTSTDVVDTAMSILYKEASEILRKDILALLQTYKSKALKYESLPSIARTHGMHAEVTSFGLRFARFYDELNRDLSRLDEATKELCLVKLEGAVGNYAFASIEAEKLVSEELALPTPNIATQVISRDNHAYYLNVLALIASHIENVSVEFRNLARPEINEAYEFFSKGQKGSSAMPHKHNPIGFENMCGLARLVRGYAVESYDNIPLYHERDISHSSYERIAFPDAIGLIDYLLRRMKKTIDKLVVNEEQIRKNIYLSKGVVFSERVLSEAIKKGMSREEAYDEIQRIAFDVMRSDSHDNFEAGVKKSPILSKLFSSEEIHALFDESYYLRNTEYIYKRVGLVS